MLKRARGDAGERSEREEKPLNPASSSSTSARPRWAPGAAMAASSRRSLACSFYRIARRFNPSVAHLASSSSGGNEDRHPQPPPFDATSPSFSSHAARPFFSAHRSLAGYAGDFGILSRDRRGLGFSRYAGVQSSAGRYYSSSPGGSGDVEYMKDIATVLTDKSVDVAAGAVAQVAPVASEVALAAADSAIPVAALQHLIDAVHSFTGLNWSVGFRLVDPVCILLQFTWAFYSSDNTSDE